MPTQAGFRKENIPAYSNVLSRIRGEKPSAGSDTVFADSPSIRLARLLTLMDDTYPGSGGLHLFSSPGRTEIGGNHTDHQGGCVLCAAVDLDIVALVRRVDEPIVRLSSEGFGRSDTVDLRQTGRQDRETGHSASLIRGIAAWYRDHGFRVGGFEAYTASQVPSGSGLSSSAAFELLVAQIFNVLFNDGIVPPVSRAQASQYAENEYFGKPCGLMDQMACALGGVTMIDFADPAAPLVAPVESGEVLDSLVTVVTDTGGSHASLTWEYASIPQDMGLVARVFCADRLSSVDPAIFYERLPRLAGTVSDRAVLRAMHYFAETRRAREEAEALRDGDSDRFLQLVNASGRSSWMLLQNVQSGRQGQDQRLALGLAFAEKLLDGKGAVRVHGGGFAGTFQCFVPLEMLDRYLAGMDALFGAASSSILRIRPMGACEVVLP